MYSEGIQQKCIIHTKDKKIKLKNSQVSLYIISLKTLID